MKILLTGGLGYIGSHIANIIGKNAIIIDNRINSSLNYKKFLPKAIVYKKDINFNSLSKIFNENSIKGVIHLAGLKAVNESINHPLKYYKSNIGITIDLLKAMEKYNVQNLIFSSSATVYGNKNKSPLKEEMTVNAINPYGQTKIIIENMISDFASSNKNFHAISLRYFNPIGADIKAGLNDNPLEQSQNIMPILTKSIKEKKIFKIFGGDYQTKDGTCVRDYIHIKDLAKAHVLAFRKLKEVNGHKVINLGLGKGASVLEILKLFEKVNKVVVNYKFVKRRKGDVGISYADNKKAISFLKWKPKHDYIDMLRDVWEASLKK